MKLCRYTSFESFVDLIQSKTLNFVYPPIAWEDTYEGFLNRAFKTQKGRIRILELLNDYQKPLAEHVLCDDKALGACRYMCFSEAIDSLAMWSIYSNNNKAIMYETTDEEILSLGIKGELYNKPVMMFPVRYTDMLTLEEEVNIVFDKASLNTTNIFKCKRSAFSHEKEWRAFVIGNEGSDIEKPLKVPIIDISKFIINVLVHPSAPDWYVNVVKEFCATNKITFQGKSKIFELTF